ncbi:MAG: vWA domain-containing protein [Kofleriaceae bacterium]
MTSFVRMVTSGAAVATIALGCGPQSRGERVDADPGQPVDALVLPPFPDAGNCGQQTEQIAVENLGEPPDLLIVLDRSGSMDSPIVSFPPTFPPDMTPKWEVMSDALNALAEAREDNIRFGLMEFPTDDLCAVDGTTLRVPIALDQAAAIRTYLDNRAPDGGTPASLGLAAALAHYQSIPVNPDGRFVLFATDGEPGCVDDADEATVDAVEALACRGIPTYVLGFGGGFDFGSILNAAALAGGVPQAGGPPHYYDADSPATLTAVLDEIAGGIITPSCSYALATLPPDADLVIVSADGTPVPRSTQHTNGWDYHPDASTITFFGSYCDGITAGTINEIDFEYGCPGPEID